MALLKRLTICLLDKLREVLGITCKQICSFIWGWLCFFLSEVGRWELGKMKTIIYLCERYIITCPLWSVIPNKHLFKDALNNTSLYISSAYNNEVCPYLIMPSRTLLNCSFVKFLKMLHSGFSRISKATEQWWFSNGDMSL